jgi:hypothetical protein
MGLGLLRVSLDLARELGDPSTQLKPLNNLVSFLATRDLRAARDYADEGLALVRRLGDHEWGLTLRSSAVHVYWNLGEWDDLLALADEIDYDLDLGPVVLLTAAYAVEARRARGLPPAIPTIETTPGGIRTDVVLDAATALLDGFQARATGDVTTAAARSFAAVIDFTSTSGIDDDFPIFWVTAVDDQLELGRVDEARRLLALVTDAPKGHVPPLVRLLLPWLAARADLLAGAGPSVADDLAAAAAGLRALGARFYAARAQLDHAIALQSAGLTGEATAAVELARQEFAAMGAQPWVERCSPLLGDRDVADDLPLQRGLPLPATPGGPAER